MCTRGEHTLTLCTALPRSESISGNRSSLLMSTEQVEEVLGLYVCVYERVCVCEMLADQGMNAAKGIPLMQTCG